jgi:hypothetical protein
MKPTPLYSVCGYTVENGVLLDRPNEDPKLRRFWKVADHPLTSHIVPGLQFKTEREIWVTVIDTRKGTMEAALEYEKTLNVPNEYTDFLSASGWESQSH